MIHAALTEPDRLWSAQEDLLRPSPVPAAAGIYGWHFERASSKELRAQARQRARELDVSA
ncbi:hypothetical protein CW362_07880 [Streptomyces populi]|uniref:Uncharacterized protein n=1 Tax=Streptomyces populi TaxID=2058924 RepID=A0A2I0SU80_9ACTN|nr:hypothetical protein CW362_07880 [Streptomyces populi]